MKKNNYILWVFLLFIFASCEEVIDVDIPAEADKVMVEGYVTTETDSSYIRLTKTVSYFDNTSPIPVITNAVVTVNNDTFYHIADGIYKPAAGYVGVTGTLYKLNINVNGSIYTSSAILDPMYTIDTIVSVFKPKEGFIEEGYTARFVATDNRARGKYTYFRFGGKDMQEKDSLVDFRILFDNKTSPIGEPYDFELPLLRLEENDTLLMIFRSVDEAVYRYFLALSNRGDGGPFSVPPANVPTNIRGGAIGLFAAYDVKRFRYKIVK